MRKASPALMRTRGLAAAALGILLLLSASCGGDGGNGTPTGPSGDSPGPTGATITIGANGVISPSSVTISVGQSVTFVNNNSRPHQLASDPHPTHTQCPAINALGTLAAGQSRPTNAFTGAASCGFHDHNDPGNSGLQGTIVVR